MLFLADCKMRMDETTKYFVFNTICSFMFVIPLGRLYKLGSKIENIFVDSLVGGGGIPMKMCWGNPNLFKLLAPELFFKF